MTPAVPTDALFWADQVASAYAAAPLSSPPATAPVDGWSVWKWLWVTDRFALWKEKSLIGFILARATGECAIINRGTDSPIELAEDMEAVLAPGIVPGESVETGFSGVYGGIVLDDGTPLNAWIMANTAPKTFVGHSLGASTATIGARRAIACGYAPVRLLTFASPRTGNGEFAQVVSGGITPDSARIDNVRDIVPDLPPEDLGFAHVAPGVSVDSFTIPSIGRTIDDRHALSTYRALAAAALQLQSAAA